VPGETALQRGGAATGRKESRPAETALHQAEKAVRQAKRVLTENCKYATFKSSSNTGKRNSSGKETYRELPGGERQMWGIRELAFE